MSARVASAGREPRLGQDRGVDPVRQLAELRQGLQRVVGRVGQQRGGAGVAVGLGASAGEPEVVGEGEEPLLRPVVEVALEPAPRGVAGLDDAVARGAEVLELAEHLGLQALVLEREPDGGADLALELRHRRRMRDDRDLAGRPGRAA